METLIQKLPKDKIKINWNKNPVPMQIFLSFLTVPTIKIHDHLGSSTNWTQYENEDYKLRIRGGVCDGGHWLHTIEYGVKLENSFNNYVNPFYLFEIMNQEGKMFFLNYYKDEIEAVILKQKNAVQFAKQKLSREKETLSSFKNELEQLTQDNQK